MGTLLCSGPAPWQDWLQGSSQLGAPALPSCGDKHKLPRWGQRCPSATALGEPWQWGQFAVQGRWGGLQAALGCCVHAELGGFGDLSPLNELL